jgi:hypothetical protein
MLSHSVDMAGAVSRNVHRVPVGQATSRGVAALAKTPEMSFGQRLASRRLDPAITPATFLDTV